MSWLSVAMALSLLGILGGRGSGAWLRQCGIGDSIARSGRRRRHLDRMGVPKRTSSFLGRLHAALPWRHPGRARAGRVSATIGRSNNWLLMPPRSVPVPDAKQFLSASLAPYRFSIIRNYSEPVPVVQIILLVSACGLISIASRLD